RLVGKKQEDQDQKRAALLHEALGCWNPEEYEVSKQIRRLAVDFATYLQLSTEDIALIEIACFIAPYSIEFIQQQQLTPKVIKLCEEYHHAGEGIGQGEHTYSIPCQVMLLSNYRVTDRHTEAVVHINGV